MKRLILLLSIVFCLVLVKCNQGPANDSSLTEDAEFISDSIRDLTGLKHKRGLISKTDEALPGYILFSPADYSSHYLMNMDGEIVHEWEGTMETFIAYLQDNGNIIRGTRDPDFPTFNGGGQAGRIQEVTWEGDVIWDFEYATEDHLTHHDLEVLPNGNVMAIAWEVVSAEEALQAGRKPKYIPKAGMWLDHIIEIEPIKPQGGKIVWEWHMQDHLVQDIDPAKDNYAVIGENPRKINFNLHMERPLIPQEQLEEMQKGGFPGNLTVDNWLSEWGHVNALSYNADLDQIVFGSLEFNEIFIIDHSTTTEEAKGSTGGRWEHGGDFLYRWGNPQNYDAGDSIDQQLFNQHDVKWIPKGYPGEGNLTVFNNNVPSGPNALPNLFYAFFGFKDPTAVPVEVWGNYSNVLEFRLPIGDDGNYAVDESGIFNPAEVIWTYTTPDKLSLHSMVVSGAHRMSNGHTLITEGLKGRFLEVTQDAEIVWDYWNPYKNTTLLPDGKIATFPTGPFMYWQWRSTHIAVDHPALVGKELRPIEPQPDVFIPPPPPAEK